MNTLFNEIALALSNKQIIKISFDSDEFIFLQPDNTVVLEQGGDLWLKITDIKEVKLYNTRFLQEISFEVAT